MGFWEMVGAVFIGANLSHWFYDWIVAKENGEEFSYQQGRSNCCRHCRQTPDK